MAHERNTTYIGNAEGSDFQRISGSKCYGADVDMMWYTYENQAVKVVAVIDFKYPGEKIDKRYMDLPLHTANTFNVPFFVIITFLATEFKTKCYYVVPGNLQAKRYFMLCNLDISGEYFSLRRLSKLHHHIRNINWRGDEIINKKNLQAVGLPTEMRLKDLSDEVEHYTLPEIYL